MGTFSVNVQVGDVQGGKWLDVEALVDAGATHTVIPEETATALGIERLESVPFQLADDRTVEYEVGEARVRLGDQERTMLVVVGESGSRGWGHCWVQRRSNCLTWRGTRWGAG